MEFLETDELIDKELINCIKDFPALYNCDSYSENDEIYWDDIQQRLGIQKSWLKKRWQNVRNDYRKITIFNHMHCNKLPAHKLTNHLNFLTVDLNGAANLSLEDFIEGNHESFNVTQEMIDHCDIDESVTIESFSNSQHEMNNKDHHDTKPIIQTETIVNSATDNRQENGKSGQAHISNQEVVIKSNTSIENRVEPVTTNERSEDTIFGELVVAMLKKLNPEEKKRAKKEIMNILL